MLCRNDQQKCREQRSPLDQKRKRLVQKKTRYLKKHLEMNRDIKYVSKSLLETCFMSRIVSRSFFENPVPTKPVYGALENIFYDFQIIVSNSIFFDSEITLKIQSWTPKLLSKTGIYFLWDLLRNTINEKSIWSRR